MTDLSSSLAQAQEAYTQLLELSLGMKAKAISGGMSEEGAEEIATLTYASLCVLVEQGQVKRKNWLR